MSSLLGVAKRYQFYFPAAGMSGFPRKYELGLCSVQPFSKLPDKARKYIASFWDGHFDGEKGQYHVRTIQEYKKAKRKESYFCTKVSAGSLDEAVETAIHNAEQALRILKSFYLPERIRTGFGVDYYSYPGGRGMEEKYLSPQIVPYYHTAFPEVEKQMQVLNRIVQTEKQDEMARRCVSGVEVFGMINYDTPRELKFLLSVIATEGLLLGSDDKDFLGWKLREKVAFILGDTPLWIMEFLGRQKLPTPKQCKRSRIAARTDLAKKIRDMYDKRSRFSHQDRKTRITSHDYRFASMIFRHTLQRVLSLYVTKGIRRVSKRSAIDMRSLDGFIEAMKYSVPLRI